MNVFAILADADRRRIIRTLIENDGQSTIEDLSRQIASRRQGASGGDAFDEERKRITIGLVHNHLPRLEDHGVIEYDGQSGDVALDDAEELGSILAATTTQKRPISLE